MIYAFQNLLRDLTNAVLPYARWRESYLRVHPEHDLFPWLEGGLRHVSETREEAIEEAGPVIEFGEKGKKMVGSLGALAVIAIAVLLASDS